MRYLFASSNEADIIVPMNQQLIHDEGHRNSMSRIQLRDRMFDWLSGDYQAVIFEDNADIVGYALYIPEPEYIYLRQLFVIQERRREGIARRALEWLWANAWTDTRQLRIDVLVGNKSAQEFWRSVGFTEYCITMEAQSPNTTP